MNRNSGALASLTATYTDSDISDAEDDETGFTPNLVSMPVLNPAPVDTFFSTSRDSNNFPEMGHITDEEQSSTSDRDDIVEDDDDVVIKAPVPLNIKDMAPSPSEVQIPPEPPGRASNHLQEKIAQYYDRMLREGRDMNAEIQNQKKFRNPSIYEKLIQFCQINEFGTNYTPDIYDPKQFGSSSYYEEIAKAQKTEMDKRQKEQKERTKVEFITGTAKKLPSGETSLSDDTKKRKSKWDVGAGQGIPVATLLKPSAGLSQQPSLVPITAVASGTKAMVISAYGTITKKSKQ